MAPSLFLGNDPCNPELPHPQPIARPMSEMMFQREFECPSCGGPMPQRSPGARTLVCGYCGQTSHLNADSLEAAGDQHLLIDYGSNLAIGQSRRLPSLEKNLMIIGRIRLDYSDGFWDEWYALDPDDGQGYWIQEDDGQFVVFKAEKELGAGVSFDAVQVGQWDDLGGAWEQVFITSKSRAKVNGGEGELPFRIVPGEPADFVEGIHEGKGVSAELLPDEKMLFVGEPVALAEMTLS